MGERHTPIGSGSGGQLRGNQAPAGDLSQAQSGGRGAPTGDSWSAQSTENYTPTGVSSSSPSTEHYASTGQLSSSRLLRIHILCPSLPAPNRFTANNIPLSLTVGGLRCLITEMVPTHPAADVQRLIFQGKSLANDYAKLGDILTPPNGFEYTIHLVLPLNQGRTNTTTRSSGPQGINNEPQPAPVPVPASRVTPSSNSQPNPGLYYRGRAAGGDTTSIPDNSLFSSAEAALSRGFTSFQRPQPSPQEIYTVIRMLNTELTRIECQLNGNILPSLQALFHLQTQLHQIREDCQRAASEGGWDPPFIELNMIQMRILSAHRLADQIVIRNGGPQLRPPNAGHQLGGRPTPPWMVPREHLLTDGSELSDSSDSTEIFFVDAPDGSQSLVYQDNAIVATPLAAVPGQHQAQAAPFNGAFPAAPDQGPVMVQELVRRAVRNVQQRRDNANRLGRHIRRVWLFARLYCACFLFSQSGTWTRIILVTAAAITSLVSDTFIPHLVYSVVVEPALRHLENLARVGGPTEHRADVPNEQNTNHAGNRLPESGLAAGWQFLQRTERALVLLLASLIPGVGERQVQARVAAEAERARQVEQMEERQREQAEEQAQSERAPASATGDTRAGDEHM